MSIELSPLEARVIGCLIEKAVTTPDYYPLTLNSLLAACNQKSNREPVLQLEEGKVQGVVNGLIDRRLVSDESAFNSRARKFAHRFCNTPFGDLKLTDQELGVVCCLLLRGPQTPGELRSRTNRLCSFTDVKEVESVLNNLADRDLVVCLAREPGKRESRYRQCFTALTEDDVLASAMPAVGDSQVEALQKEVAELKAEISRLQAIIDEQQCN
jgi:uncharacterized protein YceH (UPF0502 family)